MSRASKKFEILTDRTESMKAKLKEVQAYLEDEQSGDLEQHQRMVESIEDTLVSDQEKVNEYGKLSNGK